MADEETGKRIARRNRRLLTRELRRCGLWAPIGAKMTTTPAATAPAATTVAATTEEGKAVEKKREVRLFRALEDVLQRQVLSEEEVRSAVASAIRLQAGRYNALSLGDGDGRDDEASSAAAIGDKAKTTASTASSVTSSATTSSTTSAASSRPRLVLSHWALDTALSAILKGSAPRLGRPAARTKEEISAMVTDKHERALIPNVISPQVTN
jgi:hypothetical protein